jgi:hypothetical protein
MACTLMLKIKRRIESSTGEVGGNASIDQVHKLNSTIYLLYVVLFFRLKAMII